MIPPAANNEIITAAEGNSTTNNATATSTSVRDNPALRKQFKRKIRANFNVTTLQTQKAYAGILSNIATGKACAAVDSIDDEHRGRGNTKLARCIELRSCNLQAVVIILDCILFIQKKL